MDFRAYWYQQLRPGAPRTDFARRVESTAGYLNLVASGNARPGEALCIRIERETAGAVRCEDLRDDVPWHVVRSGAKQPPSSQAA